MDSMWAEKAQPGDGTYLWQNDVSLEPKKRRQRGGRKKKTFLARPDSVINGDDEHFTPAPPPKAHRRRNGANGRNRAPVNEANDTIGHEKLLSNDGTSHRLPLSKEKTRSRLQTQHQPQTSFLLQPDTAVLSHTQSKDNHRLVAAMPLSNGKAVPPHLRMKNAAIPAPVASNTPVPSKPNPKQPALPPSPPASDDVFSQLRVVSDNDDPDVFEKNTEWTIKSETQTDSSYPNPVSEPPSEQHVFRGRDNMKNKGRGKARGGPSVDRASNSKAPQSTKPRGGHGFLKSSEIPKGDPKRWKTDWTGNNHGRDQTVWKSKGKHNKSSSFDSSNDWDSRSVDSAGWPIPREGDGDVIGDWDSRPGFRKGQNQEQIQRWLDMMESRAFVGVAREPILEDLSVVDGYTYTFASPTEPKTGVEYRTMGDIVPYYWKKDHFYGKVSPATFFDQNTKSGAPRPVHEDDLKDVRPWWETVVKGGSFLEPHCAPEVKGIDPDESISEKLGRECDYGSNEHAGNAKRRELAKAGISRAKMQRRRDRNEQKEKMKQANGGLTPEDLKPIKDPQLANIYLRHGTSDDMEAVTDIYNKYVDFSTSVPETERLATEDVRQQFLDITGHSKLPYLVAYEKGALLKGNRKAKGYRPGPPVQQPDRIVGFIRADEYGTGNDMFRYTAMVEFFTHREFLQRRIAKCLMDKMLGLLDPDHVERGGYQVADDYLEAAMPVRNIKKIMVNYIYDSHLPDKLDRMGRWLVEDLNFQENGHILDIGTKRGSSINKAIFVRETGTELNHASPPKGLRCHAGEKQ